MGNCVFKGFGVVEEDTKMMIKVVTSNGGIMELYAPITAESITNEFPGHRIFRRRDLFSQPLLHSEYLLAGELYYLLPTTTTTTTTKKSSSIFTPYRMSLDNHTLLKRSEAEVFTRYNSSGVWKVKLVISPEQLSEILSVDARTEALIESVRTVAKCGGNHHGGVGSASASTVGYNSDQCSNISGGSFKECLEKWNSDTN